MPEAIRQLRSVVVSPRDVPAEREIVSKVVAEINQSGIGVDLGLDIQVFRWEKDAYPGVDPNGPQGVIDPEIRIEDADFAVGIFWKRVGTPTAEAPSGTVHELRHAIAASLEKGSPRRHITPSLDV